MDAFPYSKKVKNIKDEDEDDTEWSDNDSGSEWSSDDESEMTETDTDEEYATDEELDEWTPVPVPPIQVKPSLDDILQRIDDLKGKYYKSILAEFYSVCKWFKNDDDLIAEFFLPDNKAYDLKNFKHIFLLKKLIEHVSYKQSHVKEYLDTISDVLPLGIVRVKKGSTVYYRIRTGISAHN
jgi:hypothetical protein